MFDNDLSVVGSKSLNVHPHTTFKHFFVAHGPANADSQQCSIANKLIYD